MLISAVSTYWCDGSIFLHRPVLHKTWCRCEVQKNIIANDSLGCDDMTRRAPFVSLHATAGTISHIGVSISWSATASCYANTSNTIMEHMSDSKIVRSSDSYHPVVYAGTNSD
jgi:hypothetical protein